MLSSCTKNRSYNACLVEALGDFGSILFLLVGARLLLRFICRLPLRFILWLCANMSCFLSIAVEKHYDQTQLEQERVCLAYVSQVTVCLRNPRQGLKQGLTQRPSVCCLLQNHLLRGGTAHSGLTGPLQVSYQSRKCPAVLLTGQIVGGIFSVESPLST